VLDRLISGAGALTDRADRLVRAVTSGRGPDVMGNRPGSVLVIAILIVASVVFGFLAFESTDNPSPRAIAPAEVAAADDIGRRVHATIDGVVADSFVETFPDDDGDGIQDRDETGDAWYYFLVDDSGSGVTVRSTRHPEDIYRYTATGTVVRDPEYVSVGVAQFGQLDGTSELELDAARRSDVPTSLILERLAKPEGVALGKGELKQLVSGRVMLFRGPRPALRMRAGTGTLLLSFDSKEARDRAAAELIGEAGLLIRDTGIAASLG
jgi:hypothetical protein